MPWMVWLSGLSTGLRANHRVAGSIPSQGACLDYRAGPQWGACKREPHVDVSSSFSFPSPLSKNKFKILKNKKLMSRKISFYIKIKHDKHKQKGELYV